MPRALAPLLEVRDRPLHDPLPPLSPPNPLQVEPVRLKYFRSAGEVARLAARGDYEPIIRRSTASAGTGFASEPIDLR
jgi:hypothetical protein